MTTKERTAMLQRLADADRWLARIYDPRRSDKHRTALWNLLMTTSEPRFRNILLVTKDIDESSVRFWDTHGRN
jgi:hypothetical protein